MKYFETCQITCHHQYYPCNSHIIVTILRNPQEILFSTEGGGGDTPTALPVLLLLCLFRYFSAEVICSEVARGDAEVFKL
jgi:hypothetical protein